MNERDFYYWLRGFFELTGAEKLDEQQVKMIKEHIDLVAKKVTAPLSIPPALTPVDPDQFKTIITCDANPSEKPSYALDWRQMQRSVFNPNDVKCVLLSDTHLTTDTNIKNHTTC